MKYNQLKAFNQSKGGEEPLMCLKNVRLGYGIAPLYNTAWEAWGGTQQHKTRTIPQGVDVPLFYSFTHTIGGVRKNYGHINVRLKDGRVWNDGKVYASLASVEKALSNIKYVGWGESVNNVRVIKEEEDMYKGHDAKYWHDQYRKYYGHTKTWRLRYESVWKKVKESLGKYLGK